MIQPTYPPRVVIANTKKRVRVISVRYTDDEWNRLMRYVNKSHKSKAAIVHILTLHALDILES